MSDTELSQKMEGAIKRIQAEMLESTIKQSELRSPPPPADYSHIRVTTGMVMLQAFMSAFLLLLVILLFVLYLGSQSELKQSQEEMKKAADAAATEKRLMQYDYQSVRERFEKLQGIIEGEHGRKLHPLPPSKVSTKPSPVKEK